MADKEVTQVKLGWCLDGHHRQCPGEVYPPAGRVVCSCRNHTHQGGTHHD